MLTSRKFWNVFFLITFILSACAPSSNTVTRTQHPNATESPSEKNTATPAVSKLNVEVEALRGTQVTVWHPWFGAQESLFVSQVAQFNTENEWDIVVGAESKSNYSELFFQTDDALKSPSRPQIVIAFPEHALEWQDEIVDLNAYVMDPIYGLDESEVSDFPEVIWAQDEVDGKRFGIPAQRTARFLIYNQSWARELGFDSPPANASEFQRQACAANKALGEDDDPENNALGGWLIDTHAMTPLSWMIAFNGGVQEEDGYRFLAPGNIAAFKYVKALQQESCAWVASTDLSAFDRFAARQALFGTASLEDLTDQSRAFVAAGSKDEWTVLPFPGLDRNAFVVYGSSFMMLQADDAPQLASWLFMRWMLSPENQARWIKSTGLFPLRDSTVSLVADYSAEHPQWATAVELLSIGELTPQLSSWRLVRIMLEDAFRDMFDTIRHPDLTDGQVPLILRQMDETVEDITQ